MTQACTELPILYTFRRCPYAIRARMAIAAHGVAVTQVEVALKSKPAELLALSPKGTVPVLRLPNGAVLAQSLEIMAWAAGDTDLFDADALELLGENDGSFKQALDLYKYAQRHPEFPAWVYRQRGVVFLVRLERILAVQLFLAGNEGGALDWAIMPFVRQFAGVDADWFGAAPFPALREWLARWQASPLFLTVMARVA